MSMVDHWEEMLAAGSLSPDGAVVLVNDALQEIRLLSFAPERSDDDRDEINELVAFRSKLLKQIAKAARDAELAALPPAPAQDDILSQDQLNRARSAFEAYFVSVYGPPPFRFLTGMETVVGTENAFFWVERPKHEGLKPGYYHSDIAAKWHLFRAGWLAAGTNL